MLLAVKVVVGCCGQIRRCGAEKTPSVVLVGHVLAHLCVRQTCLKSCSNVEGELRELCELRELRELPELRELRELHELRELRELLELRDVNCDAVDV